MLNVHHNATTGSDTLDWVYSNLKHPYRSPPSIILTHQNICFYCHFIPTSACIPTWIQTQEPKFWVDIWDMFEEHNLHRHKVGQAHKSRIEEPLSQVTNDIPLKTSRWQVHFSLSCDHVTLPTGQWTDNSTAWQRGTGKVEDSPNMVK